MFCFVLLFSSSWSLFQRSIFFNVMYFILVYIMGNKMTKYATTNTNRQIQWNSQKNQQCKRISMIVKNFWPTNECHFYYHLLHGLSKYDVCLQFYSVRTGWNVTLWSDVCRENRLRQQWRQKKNTISPLWNEKKRLFPPFDWNAMIKYLLWNWANCYAKQLAFILNIFVANFTKCFLLSPDVYLEINGWQVNLWLGWTFVYFKFLFFLSSQGKYTSHWNGQHIRKRGTKKNQFAS